MNMKKCLIICAALLGLLSFPAGAEEAEEKNPTLPGNFFIDADSDSDIDPGAEDWSSGYFDSCTVDKRPVYNSFHSWLKQMTRLYKWRLITAQEKGHYYFAIFDIGFNNSELAFCFRDIKGKERHLDLEVRSVTGNKDLRLEQWGPNASLIQEYLVHDPKSGEVMKFRELNGYIIRMRRFPRHLRVVAAEVNGKKKVVFNEVINNVDDSVHNIENIRTKKLPKTNTLDKWLKVVSMPNWKLITKEENSHGFFAAFKINDRSFAFCRQFKHYSSMYECVSALKLSTPDGKPLKIDFTSINSLNRRYHVIKRVDKESQVTKYSIFDGSTYRTKEKLPAKFRLQYIMRSNNKKPQIFFDQVVNFSK